MNYYLMHKDIKVMELAFNSHGFVVDTGAILNKEHLPLFVQRNPDRIMLWMKERAIPNTRSGLKEFLEKLGEDSPQTLLLRNYGLSLTDCYWVKPLDSGLSWSDVNLFYNDFTPIEMLYDHDAESLKGILKLSADSSLPGELKKKWFIDEVGTRVLVKGNCGSGCQQSLNEELGTLINAFQNKMPFVTYRVSKYAFEGDDQAFCCFSDNFVESDSIELVHAWEVMALSAKNNNISAFQHYVNNCVKIGFKEDYVRDFLSYMIMLDFIMTNVDRHMGNLGILRNPDTLEPIGMAPIYDCGNSMLYNQIFVKFNSKAVDKIDINSFRKKEADMLGYIFNWGVFDINKLPSIGQIKEIYAKDPGMNDRVDEIIKCYQYKVNKLSELQKRHGVNSDVGKEQDI